MTTQYIWPNDNDANNNNDKKKIKHSFKTNDKKLNIQPRWW
jgi:hypothetical protein